jgi:serine/threonine protein kinase
MSLDDTTVVDHGDDFDHPPGYEVLGELGYDGLAVTYRARQRSLERVVALRTCREGDASEHLRWCFETEATVLAQLRHPHVLRIHDRLEHAGRPYLVLEYAEGGSLDVRLAKQPQPARPAAALVARLARTLAYIHQRGILHGDLKPRRVLLAAPPESSPGSERETTGCEDVYGLPLLSGFELALDTRKEPPEEGMIRGTPAYMSPEQAQGRWREVGPAMDVYGLGALLYEMLTGRPPFRAQTPLDTLRQILGQEPVPPHQLVPGVDRALEAICLRCLRKRPAERYPGAAALAAELEGFLLQAAAPKRRWFW